MFMYKFLIRTTLVVFLCKHQSNGLDRSPTITDEVCETNSFVRTFNQPKKELFKIEQKLSRLEEKLHFTLHTSEDNCSFVLDKNVLINCDIDTEGECSKFNFTCTYFIIGKFVTATIEAAENLDDIYANTTLTSIYYNVSKSITLQYCSLDDENLSVTSNLSYGESVDVQCVDKGSHIVQGENVPSNNELTLTCDECGQWKTNDPVYCVKVTLETQLVYLENATANFICKSNEDVWLDRPPNYYLNRENITGQHDNFLLYRQHHNSIGYCVMYFNNTNKSAILSSFKTITVHYQPYDVIVNVSSTYVIVHTDDDLVLIYDQNVIVHCSSDSNPTANCSFNIGSETIKLDGTCDVAYRFSQSANVTCTASNELNNVTSSTIEVVLLQPREDFTANLSQTNQEPITESDLTLDCSIPYQEELRTIFSWTIPSDRDLEKGRSILYLDNLTRFDIGNYTCTTSDVFGVSSRTTFVDVYYPPEEIESTTQCHWSDVENNDCLVTFTSNPSAEIYTLTRNGSSYHCSYCRWEQSLGDKYRQTFILKLEEPDSQTFVYQVRLTSSYHLFEDLIVEFVVKGSDVTPQTVNQTALIVGCVVGVVLLLGVVIALGCVYHRNKNKVLSEKEITEFSSTKKLHGLNSKAAKCSDANVYEDIDLKKMNKDTNDSKQASNEKEDRLNPLYAVREDISDVKKSSTTTNCDKETENNSDEKEDRINPIYDIGRETPVEHVYAEVEKTSKKNINSLDNPNEQEQSEKEDRVNPLYAVREENADGHHLYAQIDKSTKKANEKGQVEKEEQINPLYDVGQGKGDKNVNLDVMRNDTGQEEQVNPQYGEELRQKTELEHNYDEVHF